MNKFSQKAIMGSLMASILISVQAQAQIQTSVISDSYRLHSDEIQNFSKETPCYLKDIKDHTDAFDKKVLQLFKDEGFNITDDESVDCKINIGGWIHSDSGGKTLYAHEPDKWIGKEVDPNPKVAAAINDAKDKAAVAQAGEPIGANGINMLTQAGGLVGSNGAAIAGGSGIVINLLSLFSGGHSSPGGVADISGTIRFGRYFQTTQVSTEIYAASNVPEKPEDLFYAGIKGVIEDLKMAIYKYHVTNKLPFDMPVSAELAAKGKTWANPATAQAAGK
ncbi:MAG: hypothetical protein ACYCSS_10270 [Sulfuriferula sp.]